MGVDSMRLDTLTVLNTLATISDDGTLVSLVLKLKPDTVTSRRKLANFKKRVKDLGIPVLLKVEAKRLQSGHLLYHAHITLPATPETANLLTALGAKPKEARDAVCGTATYALREQAKRVLAYAADKPSYTKLNPWGGSWQKWARYMRKDTQLPGLAYLWHFHIPKPDKQKPAAEQAKPQESQLQLTLNQSAPKAFSTLKTVLSKPVPSSLSNQPADGKVKRPIVIHSNAANSNPLPPSPTATTTVATLCSPKILPSIHCLLTLPLNSPGGAVFWVLSTMLAKEYHCDLGRVHTCPEYRCWLGHEAASSGHLKPTPRSGLVVRNS